MTKLPKSAMADMIRAAAPKLDTPEAVLSARYAAGDYLKTELDQPKVAEEFSSECRRDADGNPLPGSWIDGIRIDTAEYKAGIAEGTRRVVGYNLPDGSTRYSMPLENLTAPFVPKVTVRIDIMDLIRAVLVITHYGTVNVLGAGRSYAVLRVLPDQVEALTAGGIHHWNG